MSETPARYVTESDREKAQTIAKLCWYTGRASLQTLAWFLEIDEDEVESIIGSNEHLAAIEELIRTRPNRKPVSIEDWWTKEWKDKPSAFARRMRLSETDVSELIEKVLRSL
ncbi:MAG: hypothetical protein OXC79_05255 [Candidatus Poribacteria bacterium]|nr:hypothetical protein [Candidatus Poribacteria bacterium]